MDMLVLVALVVLAIPIALVWVIVSHSNLSTRVRALEADVARLRGEVADAHRPEPRPESLPLAGEAPEPEAVPVLSLPAPIAARSAPVETVEAAPVMADADPLSPSLPPRQPDTFDRFGTWLRENWVYAVAAVSLAAAGVFLVQYGMERGLLPPGLRVMAGIAFGLALIGSGEVIRRRFGDGRVRQHVTTAITPLAMSIERNGLAQRLGPIVRPQDVLEHQFGIGGFP